VNPVQAIIPAAGLGTRMLPLSRSIPKELLPLGRKPALAWIAEELAAAGIGELVLVVSEAKHDLGQRLEAAWLDAAVPMPTVRIEVQPHQRGLGDAILCAARAIRREPFVVALGDCVLGLSGATETTRLMLGLMRDHAADAVIAFQPVPASLVSRFGIADPERESAFPAGGRSGFRLSGIVEKPMSELAPSHWAVAGRFVFSHRILELLAAEQPGQAGEIQLTPAIARLIDEGGKVLGLPLAPDEPRFDLGDYDSWCQAFVRFALVDNPRLLDEVGQLPIPSGQRTHG
jgi:UTP--glucose-1-phosphate uridylyltransferase